MLKSGVHSGGRGRAGADQAHLAWAVLRLRDQRLQFLVQPGQDRRIGIAELEHHLCLAGHDARRPGVKRDLASVQTVRSLPIEGKRSLIAVASRTSATPASLRRAIRVVPAWFCSPSNTMRNRDCRRLRSPRRSGRRTVPVRRLVRYALPGSPDSVTDRPARAAGHPIPPDPAPRATGRRRRAVAWYPSPPRTVGRKTTGCRESRRTSLPHRTRRRRRCRHPECARLQSENYAHRTIQPAGMRLGLDVTAHQQLAAGRFVAAKHVGNAVDFGGQAGIGQLLRQPEARLDVLRRQRGPCTPVLYSPIFRSAYKSPNNRSALIFGIVRAPRFCRSATRAEPMGKPRGRATDQTPVMGWRGVIGACASIGFSPAN